MKSHFTRVPRLICASLIALMAFAPGTHAAQIAFDPGLIPGGLPAFLLSSNPANNTPNVPVNTPVSFMFLSAMAPAYKVDWSGSIDASKFTYKWSADAKTLTCTYTGNFPANTTISWTLDPSVFKDTSGGELMAVNNSGSFTTGSGESNPNDPCNGGGTNSNSGALSMFKSINYIQTSTAAPAIDPDSGATFGVFLKGSATDPVSQASFQLPNGTTKSVTNFFGSFMFYDQFSTEAAMDAAYPSGAYKFTIKTASGTSTMTLTVPASGPPTPHISNFTEVQAFNPTADLTVRWDPFTGVAVDDSISFDMNDQTVNFHAPDPCVPRELKNTDISILVPRNTFGTGTLIDGSLTFGKVGSFDTNSIPGIAGFSGYSKMTSFKPGNSGNPEPEQPVLQNFVRQPNGAVQFQVKGTATIIVVEASEDLEVWDTIMTAPSPSGLLDVVDPLATGKARRYYRASAE
jgi:hypothetical protein